VTRPSSCIVPGCAAPAAEAPVELCAAHVAALLEWHDGAVGVTDVLPAPCRVCGSRLGVRWPSGWLCEVCEWRHGDVPDDELPPPRVDVVYYLRYRDRVKIGTTANPRQRLAAIAHDELLAFERGDRVLERRRHEQFAAERHPRSEWFRLSPTLGAHIDAVAAGVEDPWMLHVRWCSEALALRG
jgi:hypothetical protein